jgi:hypothetical protein
VCLSVFVAVFGGGGVASGICHVTSAHSSLPLRCLQDNQFGCVEVCSLGGVWVWRATGTPTVCAPTRCNAHTVQYKAKHCRLTPHLTTLLLGPALGLQLSVMRHAPPPQRTQPPQTADSQL